MIDNIGSWIIVGILIFAVLAYIVSKCPAVKDYKSIDHCIHFVD